MKMPEEFAELLGKVPDAKLAELAGVELAVAKGWRVDAQVVEHVSETPAPEAPSKPATSTKSKSPKKPAAEEKPADDERGPISVDQIPDLAAMMANDPSADRILAALQDAIRAKPKPGASRAPRVLQLLESQTVHSHKGRNGQWVTTTLAASIYRDGMAQKVWDCVQDKSKIRVITE